MTIPSESEPTERAERPRRTRDNRARDAAQIQPFTAFNVPMTYTDKRISPLSIPPRSYSPTRRETVAGLMADHDAAR